VFHYKRFLLLIDDGAPQTCEGNSEEGRLKPKASFQISVVINLHLPNALPHLKLRWEAQGGPSYVWDGLYRYQVPCLWPA